MSVTMKCGFALRDITPGLGVLMDGFGYREGPSLGVHDSLYVKVACFTGEKGMHILLCFDNCGLCRDLEPEISQFLCSNLSIDRKCLTLTSTHTHSGPACGILKDLPLDPIYWDRVKQDTLECIRDAMANAEPCTFAPYKSHVDFPVNRRVKKNGVFELSENPDGYADHSVGVVSVYSEDSSLKGVISLASCHPTCLDSDNRLISADYPGAMYKRVSSVYSDAVVLFMNSGSGDVNPSERAGESRMEFAERCGFELASAVIECVENGKRESLSGAIAVEWENVPLLFEDLPPRETLQQALIEYTKRQATSKNAVMRFINTRYVNWYKNALMHPEGVTYDAMSAPVQVVVIGDELVIVALPFEVFSSTVARAMRVVQDAGYRKDCIFVTGYSNGVYGYLPPADVLDEGGYECDEAFKWYDLPSRYAHNMEDSVIITIANIVNRLRIKA